jgi:hypothetical protein
VMGVLYKSDSDIDKFSWVDYDYYPNSHGFKVELHCKKDEGYVSSMLTLFYRLFGEESSDIVIGQPFPGVEWGQFCIDTWNFDSDSPNYDFENKSAETVRYLNFLLESRIEFNYQGLCGCNDWRAMLLVVLECIISHKAPYSLLFYNLEGEYFFYFHHSFSIGLYYKEKNQSIADLFDRISADGDVEVV